MNTKLSLVEKAEVFATAAHAAVKQVRKYSGLPYIVHPRAVVELLKTHASSEIIEEQIAAAFGHDLCEDTGVELDLIREMFGDLVAELVDDLTDISKPEDGNRRVRKNIDLEHTRQANPLAKSIKLADTIDNIKSITEADPNFARTYLRERMLVIEACAEGDPGLLAEAYRVMNECKKKLNLL